MFYRNDFLRRDTRMRDSVLPRVKSPESVDVDPIRQHGCVPKLRRELNLAAHVEEADDTHADGERVTVSSWQAPAPKAL
jgi:hypothetical protein